MRSSGIKKSKKNKKNEKEKEGGEHRRRRGQDLRHGSGDSDEEENDAEELDANDGFEGTNFESQVKAVTPKPNLDR